MNRKKNSFKLGIIIILLCLLSIAVYSPVQSSEEVAKRYEPQSNNGEKWRIGYSETDPFSNFAGTFYSLVYALEQMGWISGTEDIPYTHGQSDSKVMWEWLSSRDLGPYIEFVDNAHYSLIDSEDVSEQMLSRLSEDSDIDLMIAMGTLPGIILSDDRNHVATMVFSSSNAVSSGIIESVEDSGKDKLWAHMDPDRYHRQIEVFYDIFQFEKLGLVYEDSDEGRIYAAVSDVTAKAAERGFEVIERHVNEPRNEAEQERYYQEVLAANQQLAQEVDAMYLTFGTWELEKLPQLLKPFFDHNVPVFSQMGIEEVNYGALMSLARANFEGIGYFGAQNIASLFHGTLPRELPQVYGDTPSIALNLQTADMIEYKIPFEILLAADEIIINISGQHKEETNE